MQHFSVTEVTGDAAAAAEELERRKEEKEKLLSTKEAAETLKDELSSRSRSQLPFVRAAN